MSVTENAVTLARIESYLDQVSRRLDELSRRSESPARFLTISGAAKRTSLSEKSIRRAVSAGKLVGLRPVRGRLLVDVVQLDQFCLTATKQIRRGRGHRRQEN